MQVSDYEAMTRDLIQHYRKMGNLYRIAGPLFATLLASNYVMVFYRTSKNFMLNEGLMSAALVFIALGLGALAGEKLRLRNLEKAQRLLKELASFGLEQLRGMDDSEAEVSMMAEHAEISG